MVDKPLFTPGPLTTSPTVKAAMGRDLGSRDTEFIGVISDLRNSLLQRAKVNFAVLGPEERCAGESVRRMGDEFLFQELAAKNIATFAKHNVKKIVTHCLNSLRQDYPQFDGHYEVVHHTQYLGELVAAGKLKAAAVMNETVTYHDPCYLARVNGITEAPRALLPEIKECPPRLPNRLLRSRRRPHVVRRPRRRTHRHRPSNRSPRHQRQNRRRLMPVLFNHDDRWHRGERRPSESPRHFRIDAGQKPDSIDGGRPMDLGLAASGCRVLAMAAVATNNLCESFD